MKTEYIKCPFCKEDDFDLIGLKLHLKAGNCEVFEETPTDFRPTPVVSKGDANK